MAQKGLQLDRETFTCSICLDLLNDPVALACGHNYCMKCISSHWDEKEISSCPQCRQTFTPRPVLVKNTMLAAVVEQLKNTELQDSLADVCYAGPEDVACDVCTGRKLKAVKSCLRCLVSFCEEHLQPHHHVDQYKKHQLVKPSKKLKENICPHHDEVIKMFCRTDQQCICLVCSLDEHKGHNTVSVATERKESQAKLELSRQNVQKKVQDREKDVKLLHQEAKALNLSAGKTLKNNKKIFTELIRLMEKKQLDLEQQVISQYRTELGRVKELQDKLEQEITELKRQDAELEQLSHTQDDTQFVRSFRSLASKRLKKSADSSIFNIRPLKHYEDLTAALSELGDGLQDLLKQKWTNITETVTEVDALLSSPSAPPEPRTRAGFLKYSHVLTLDSNTAGKDLVLSQEKRRATLFYQNQNQHSNQYRTAYGSQTQCRFTGYCQILSKEILTDRSYWEVVWSGSINVSVAYKDRMLAGYQKECELGRNSQSWSLRCFNNRFEFYHNDIVTPVSGPLSSRVGVYLDHKAGILSFYSICFETMTLLHRVQTTFTGQVSAGFRILNYGDTVKFCDPKQPLIS